jgi:serine/threonine protein phosphatase Stp1
MMQGQSASRCHAGSTQRCSEDALLARDDLRFWAIADGLGGHADGKWAANAVIETLDHALGMSLTQDSPKMADAIASGHRKINDVAMRLGGPIATTVAALGFRQGNAHGIWVGNCRVYRLRAERLSLMTEDHSVASELVARGQLDPLLADSHPLAKVLTQAIGSGKAPIPARFVDKALIGDRYLLCSNGLPRVLPEGDIERQLGRGTPDEAADRLIGLALSRGAPDNLGVIVIDNLELGFN